LSSEYHGLGVAALNRDGRVVDEVLTYIWSAYHGNVQFHGDYSGGIDGALVRVTGRL
jgi:hypothetical protein